MPAFWDVCQWAWRQPALSSFQKASVLMSLPLTSPISVFVEIALGWKETRIQLLRNRALSSNRTILMIMKVDHERKILVDQERKIFIEKKFFKISVISPNNNRDRSSLFTFTVWGSFSGGDLVSCDNPIYWEWCVGRLTSAWGEISSSSPRRMMTVVRHSPQPRGVSGKVLPNAVKLLLFPGWLSCHVLYKQMFCPSYFISLYFDLWIYAWNSDVPETDRNFQSSFHCLEKRLKALLFQ